MTRTSIAHGFLVTLLVAAHGLAPAAAPRLVQTGALPTDARSVQENYDDWTVACVQRDAKRLCSLSQQQLDKDSRQRVVALELSSVAADKADGTLLLPFGLALDQKVILQLDGAQFGSPLPYRTCLAAGCLVKVSLDTRSIGDLKKATALTVKTTADGGQPLTFTLSLKGFASAFDRTAALGK